VIINYVTFLIPLLSQKVINAAFRNYIAIFVNI